MNKKLTLLTLAGLTLAGTIELSAATWKVKNSLGRDICVTVNTGVSQIRRFIANGAEVPFISKACLYSISVKEGSVKDAQTGKMVSLKTPEGRCPSGLENISKITIKEILDYSSQTLMQKGKSISAAENKTKAILDTLKAEVEKLLKLCKDMNFEVISENGQPKIIMQGIKAAQPAPTPISPAPPVVMPTTETEGAVIPPAPPVMPTTATTPKTTVQPTPGKTEVRTQPSNLLEEIRAGKPLKGQAEQRPAATPTKQNGSSKSLQEILQERMKERRGDIEGTAIEVEDVWED